MISSSSKSKSSSTTTTIPLLSNRSTTNYNTNNNHHRNPHHHHRNNNNNNNNNTTKQRNVIVTPITTTTTMKQQKKVYTGTNTNTTTTTTTNTNTSKTTNMIQKVNQQNNNKINRFIVDQQIVDELLLVCGVIGTTTTISSSSNNNNNTSTNNTNSTIPMIIPVTDCVQWLQDLQRCLRRDDDQIRTISILLYHWNIIQTKLLPLINYYTQYDTILIITICKILVLLLKPLHYQTIQLCYSHMNIQNKNISNELLQEQIKLRENALEQASILMDYKRIFCHYGSTTTTTSTSNNNSNRNHHHHPNKTKTNNNNETTTNTTLFSIFVALLGEPLSRIGNSRTDNDHLTIELIIYLFRNLLLIEPIGTTKNTNQNQSINNDIHYELITKFDNELIFDIIYVLCADIEQRENISYNLLLMELIQLLLKHQNPIRIAQDGYSNSNSSSINNSSSTGSSSNEQNQPSSSTSSTSRNSRNIMINNNNNNTNKSSHNSSSSSSLLRSIQREKQSILSYSTSRHSQFGGTIILENKDNGYKQCIGTTSIFNHRSSNNNVTLNHNNSTSSGNSSNSAITQLLLSRRKNKQLEPFIVSNNNSTNTTSDESYKSYWYQQSIQSLYRFCMNFLIYNKCYGPLMKSLKNEFRRDSVRLEDNDRIIYFQVVTFFSSWYRTYRSLQLQQQKQKQVPMTDESTNHEMNDNRDGSNELDNNGTSHESSSLSSIGQLIFTMDVFSFNLVLNATDTFQEHKKYGPLTHSIALLREMMHLLYVMMCPDPTVSNNNSNTTTTTTEPSTTSNDTNTMHTERIMAMGLMDRLFYTNDPLDRLPKLLSRWTPATTTREYACDLIEICHMTLQVLETNEQLCRQEHDHSNNNSNNKDDTMKQHDTVEKMKVRVLEFDIESYFVRKLVSNHIITLYTHLLSYYNVNTPEINQYIISYFERIRQHIVSSGSDDAMDTGKDDIGIEGVDEDDDEDLILKNPFPARTVTLEPMLYNVQLFIVLNNILNDTSIRSDPAYQSVLTFATTMTCNFAIAAQKNPVLFIEILFKHPSPHRICDLITNSYITDDLRMLVERDLLLQQQYQLDQRVEALTKTTTTNNQIDDPSSVNRTTTTNIANDEEESSDEELEFIDVPLDESGTSHQMKGRLMNRKKNRKTKNKLTKTIQDSDEDDDDDEEKGDDANRDKEKEEDDDNNDNDDDKVEGKEDDDDEKEEDKEDDASRDMEKENEQSPLSKVKVSNNTNDDHDNDEDDQEIQNETNNVETNDEIMEDNDHPVRMNISNDDDDDDDLIDSEDEEDNDKIGRPILGKRKVLIGGEPSITNNNNDNLKKKRISMFDDSDDEN